MAVRTNFKAVLDKIRGSFNEAIDQDQLKLLGDEAIRKITVRTRLGYGVEKPGAPRKKLKELSQGYIESRLKAKGRLSSMTAPARSNLTFTGQLLDSLKVVVARGKLSIEPTGSRRDGQSNQDVADSVSKKRPFISLSDLELKALKRFYEVEIVRKMLRKRGLT